MSLLAVEVKDIFGTITAPSPVAQFISKDSTTFGISPFLSNLISLFYVAAAIVLVFMLLWGAFDWMVSEGNKEKIQAAQQKIISAVIGIILFAVAFAIITIIGQFTGFEFFKDQNKLFQQSSEGTNNQNRINRNNQIQNTLGPGGGL